MSSAAKSFFQIELLNANGMQPTFAISPPVNPTDPALGILFQRMQEFREMLNPLLYKTQKALMIFWYA